MKIDKTTSSLPPAVGDAGSRTQSSPRAQASQAAPESSTSVHLGTTTAKLRSLESSLATSPMVDASKVAEIKQAISEGRFQVNSGVVADRLIQTVRDMIGTGMH